MDKLRDKLNNRRKGKLRRDEDLTIGMKKRNRRFHIRHKKNSSCRERGRPEKQQLRKAKWRILKILVILS